MTAETRESARGDGRASDMLRRQRLHRHRVDGARGSAEYAIDGTVVVAAVHGPQAVKPWREDHERGVIDFELTSRGRGMTRDEERACEGRVRGAIEATVVRYDFRDWDCADGERGERRRKRGGGVRECGVLCAFRRGCADVWNAVCEFVRHHE